jgi:hypothetical protein
VSVVAPWVREAATICTKYVLPFFLKCSYFYDTHSMTIGHYFWLNKCSSTVAVFYGRDDVAAYWCPQVMSPFSEVELGMTLSANL